MRSGFSKKLIVASFVVWAGCAEEAGLSSLLPVLASETAHAKPGLSRVRDLVSGDPASKGVLDPAGHPLLTDTIQQSYSGSGKRDPFRSFRFENEEEAADSSGPLADYDLSQLAVVAVVWDTQRARALVADPSGRSFLVQKASRIGKNEGRVRRIADDLMVVQETYTDFEGNKISRNVEMRIRRNVGG